MEEVSKIIILDVGSDVQTKFLGKYQKYIDMDSFWINPSAPLCFLCETLGIDSVNPFLVFTLLDETTKRTQTSWLKRKYN